MVNLSVDPDCGLHPTRRCITHPVHSHEPTVDRNAPPTSFAIPWRLHQLWNTRWSFHKGTHRNSTHWANWNLFYFCRASIIRIRRTLVAQTFLPWHEAVQGRRTQYDTASEICLISCPYLLHANPSTLYSRYFSAIWTPNRPVAICNLLARPPEEGIEKDHFSTWSLIDSEQSTSGLSHSDDWMVSWTLIVEL